jgi:hypothetical protein
LTDPLRLLIEQPEGVLVTAFRNLAADAAGYTPPVEMRRELSREFGDVEVAGMLDTIASQPEVLDALGLTLAAEIAQETDGEETVREAASAAREALPVSDVEAIALVVAYALWLLATRGRRRTIRIVRRTAVGDTERIELTEWQSAGEGIDQLKRLLDPPPSADEDGAATQRA